MGFRRWLAEKLYTPEAEKKVKSEKKVKGYELYAGTDGRWLKLLDTDEPHDFEEMEDARPNHAYKLLERYENG